MSRHRGGDRTILLEGFLLALSDIFVEAVSNRYVSFIAVPPEEVGTRIVQSGVPAHLEPGDRTASLACRVANYPVHLYRGRYAPVRACAAGIWRTTLSRSCFFVREAACFSTV
ncbi:hypothetical protein NKR23_g1818 [Pleurostoma richardsiae]|uniref:Uncharacterized protein n=1 Tax=Pleurostoma richardsiae TaxID=41990 RepID=A0AA38VVU5_9PEZI|nr:hypothetical protein NKR23_g1818 [Pleurostoma richardsiae]